MLERMEQDARKVRKAEEILLLKLRLADASNGRDDDSSSSVSVKRELPREKTLFKEK